MCRLWPSKYELRQHSSQFMTDVHCMCSYIAAIPMSARSALAQDRRLLTRFSSSLLPESSGMMYPRAAARSAPSLTQACALCGRMLTAGWAVDVGSDLALIHAPKTGSRSRCRPGLHAYHSHKDHMSQLNNPPLWCSHKSNPHN